MYQAMEVSAYARVEEGTDIRFLACREGWTEFTFDKDGLVLAEAVNAAVRDRQVGG